MAEAEDEEKAAPLQVEVAITIAGYSVTVKAPVELNTAIDAALRTLAEAHKVASRNPEKIGQLL